METLIRQSENIQPSTAQCTEQRVRLEPYLIEKEVGNPTKKKGLVELAQSYGTHGLNGSPNITGDQRRVPSIWGLRPGLVSQVSCLGDALGVAGKKRVWR